jgi:hypothetical protein
VAPANGRNGAGRFRGTGKVGWMFTLAAAAHNLVRLPKLLGAVA